MVEGIIGDWRFEEENAHALVLRVGEHRVAWMRNCDALTNRRRHKGFALEYSFEKLFAVDTGRQSHGSSCRSQGFLGTGSGNVVVDAAPFNKFRKRKSFGHGCLLLPKYGPVSSFGQAEFFPFAASSQRGSAMLYFPAMQNRFRVPKAALSLNLRKAAFPAAGAIARILGLILPVLTAAAAAPHIAAAPRQAAVSTPLWAVEVPASEYAPGLSGAGVSAAAGTRTDAPAVHSASLGPDSGAALVQTFRLENSDGSPLSFAFYHITDASGKTVSGRAFGSGICLAQFSAPAHFPCRLEVNARGADAVFSIENYFPASLRLKSGMARPAASPLPVRAVFVIDSTYSMWPYFRALCDSLGQCLKIFSAAAPRTNLEAGVVFFRDRGEEYLTRQIPLSSDFDTVIKTAKREQVDKGGDDPEALADGLGAALDMLGQHGGPDALNVVFAFTDAPAKTSCAAVSARAAAMGVKIYTVGLGALKDESVRTLGGVAAASSAVFLRAGSKAEVLAAALAEQLETAGTAEAAVAGPTAPALRGGPAASLNGELSTMLARLLGAELASVKTGGSRDPALDLLDSVQSRMAAVLSYPEAARRRGSQGRVLLYLEVSPQGTLIQSRVAAGSGSTLLDRAALSLARAVFPLANPAAAPVGLYIAVSYRLTPSTGGSGSASVSAPAGADGRGP